jgi:hypothetical protein
MKKLNCVLKPAQQIIVFLTFFIANIHGDEICLVNGQSSKTEVLDTSGCEVKMLRNGNTVTINKKLIRKVIWKSDTISFENYSCPEKPKSMIRLQDTPEYKMMAILDNSPELSQVFKENSKIAFLFAPLQGNFNLEEFVGVQAPLIELFKKKATISILKPSEMIMEINAAQHQFDYAFIARKYHVEVNQIGHSDFSKMGAFGANSQGEKKKELFTFGDFILYDISKGEIVFHQTLHEKRSVWGESEYSWTGILTPDDWQKEWEKKQTDRKLDRNARAIRKKMEKEISQYLGITK